MATAKDYDVLARTLLGEAAGEGEEGMKAVGHVILNRANSEGYPDSPSEVALQEGQFSAWNSNDQGGNDLTDMGANNAQYQKAFSLAKRLLNGETEDPTGGATHYYAPAGMEGGEAPWWWNEEKERQEAVEKPLGGHIFLARHQPEAEKPAAPERLRTVTNETGSADRRVNPGDAPNRPGPEDEPTVFSDVGPTVNPGAGNQPGDVQIAQGPTPEETPLQQEDRRAQEAAPVAQEIPEATTEGRPLDRPAQPRGDRQLDGFDLDTYAGYDPNVPFTPEQRRVAQKAAEDVSWQEVWEAATASEWIHKWVARENELDSFEPDPSFRLGDLDEETKVELYEGLPEELLGEYEEARSLPQARAIRKQLDDIAEVQQILQSKGIGGLGMQALAAIFDPSAIAATIATDGALAPYVFARKIGKLTQMGRAALVGGGTNAVIEGTLATMDPQRGGLDILMAGGAGMVLGGAAGGIIPTRDQEMISSIGKDLAESAARRVEAEDAGQPTGPEKIFEQVELPDGEVEIRAVPANEASSVGAAQTPNPRRPLSDKADEWYDEAMQNEYRTVGGKARVSMYATLNRSKHLGVSDTVNRMMPDAVGMSRDGRHQEFTAAETATSEFQKHLNNVERPLERHFKEWLEEQNDAGWMSKYTRRGEFNREIARAVRREAGTYTDNKQVNAVADLIRTENERILRRAQEAGVDGFDEVLENPNYLMRVHSFRRLEDLLSTYGDDQIETLLSNAMLASSRGVTEAVTKKVAKGYLKRLQEIGNGQDIETGMMFTRGDVLGDLMRDQGIDEDTIKNVVDNAAPKKAKDGKVTRAKHRLQLDEGFSMQLTRKDGVTTDTVGFEDLLENDAQTLFRTYARQMSGHTGMAEVGITGTSDWNRLIRMIRQTRNRADGEMTVDELNEEIEKLELLRRAVLGQPLHKMNNWSKWMRMLRDYNFMRVMNQVGFAQIAELGVVTGQMGFKAMFQQMPTFHRVWSRAKNGHLNDQTADEAEAIAGIGQDRLLMSPTSQYDDHGVIDSPHVSKLERFLQYGGRVTADLSGMNAVTAATERIAAKAAFQKFANMAVGKSGKLNKRRLASLGLDDDRLEMILRNMRDHAGWEEGITGRRLATLNFEQWDAETRRIFQGVIWRWTRRAVQKNDVGDLAKWMTTDMGKMIIQFRTFATVAYEKQLMHGLAMRDTAAFISFAASMMFGGLAYITQTHVNAVGREDREEYLKERLSLPELSKATFQRAGFSTLLPTAVDHVAGIAGFDPLFAYGRSTGLAAGILGNPTIDLASGLEGSARGGIAPLVNPGYDYSQQDARNMTGAMMFQNLTGVRNITNLMMQDLPRYSQSYGD